MNVRRRLGLLVLVVLAITTTRAAVVNRRPSRFDVALIAAPPDEKRTAAARIAKRARTGWSHAGRSALVTPRTIGDIGPPFPLTGPGVRRIVPSRTGGLP